MLKGYLAFLMFMLAAATAVLAIWHPAKEQPSVPTESAAIQATDDTVTTTPPTKSIQVTVKAPTPPAKPSAPAPKPADNLAKYTDLIIHYQPSLSESTARKYVSTVVSSSTQSGIDPLWIIAMIWLESNFENQSTSSESAIGLMQILPSTGWAIGYSPHRLRDPETNIKAGVSYLATLKANFGGDIKKATTAYNQGSSRVRKGTARMWYYNNVHHTYTKMKGWIKNHG